MPPIATSTTLRRTSTGQSEGTLSALAGAPLYTPSSEIPSSSSSSLSSSSSSSAPPSPHMYRSNMQPEKPPDSKGLRREEQALLARALMNGSTSIGGTYYSNKSLLAFAAIALAAIFHTWVMHERSHCYYRLTQVTLQCQEEQEEEEGTNMDSPFLTDYLSASLASLSDGLLGGDDEAMNKPVLVHNPLLEDPARARLRSPRTAWLMSFPNSGTSFTMELVQELSNTTAASNYIQECHLDKDHRMMPTYPDFSAAEGPFLSQLPLKRMPKKNQYILTKTHCGGYEVEVGPSNFIETSHSFAVQCRSGTAYTTAEQDAPTRRVTYSEALVARAIHLMRDPFDNIVSRFHDTREARGATPGNEEWLEKYSASPEGFLSWCTEMLDQQFDADDKASRFLDEELYATLKSVPCHNEVYRYVQWHNLAVDTIRKLRLPSLLVHYEDFDHSLEKIVGEVFGFLNLKRVYNDLDQLPVTAKFQGAKKYRNDYFTSHHRRVVWNLIESLATPETLSLLQRYAEK